MKVKMHPHPTAVKGTSGIDQVVLAYARHLPCLGIEIVPMDATNYDLVAGHVGAESTIEHPYVCHLHGLYWTADYECNRWQWYVNGQITDAIRKANEVTVPSDWVAETLRRDARLNPWVIPHGIDWQDWQHDQPQGNYVLWNKNRRMDVCDATPVLLLAQRFKNQRFLTTFLPHKAPGTSNVKNLNGVVPHDKMKLLVQSCQVYLSTAKETFSIGVLEAMAAGRPILGVDWGGNSLLIEHGVNGYLASPGDFEDLVAGLEYCVKYAKTLGNNGREMAKRWTWQAACEIVARVYERALQVEPPTVAVVIPCYNLAGTLERAIESVCRQTWLEDTKVHSGYKIVVVDDGSEKRQSEKIAGIVQMCDADYPSINIELIRQHNSGVAIARNAGIAEADAKYICCLDADDAIAPDFIETCVKSLEADRSLGIAYTGLWAIEPDGAEGLSKWPSEWRFDRHLKRRNQIPTCCVFRRAMWERLGGYRQRYAPSGAGEEDAEYWLRAGAYGFKAKKVTDEGLFIYSLGGGCVSGNKEHRVTDWTGWHPWAGPEGDGQHPFVSYAAPKLFSHPVRQYDIPTASIVIPVGPGHEVHVINALDSLEAQTFRRWEAIVVNDTGSDIDTEWPSRLKKAYPYIRWVDTSNTRGPAYARNRGAEIARAPFLLWLDADDWLYPTALEKYIAAWNEHKVIIYSDFTSRTVCDDAHLAKIEAEGRLLAHLKTYENEDGRLNLIAHADKLTDYKCEIAQRQPELDAAGKPYLWCNVTALIPKAWHDAVGGFDEGMDSWEDIDYHWRLAKAGYCYRRIPEMLMVYNFHYGHRRAWGRQIHKNLIQYLRDKHKEIEPVGCRGCGRSKARAVVKQRTQSPFNRLARKAAPAVDSLIVGDDNFVWCRYMSKNRGNHRLVGRYLFNQKLEALPAPLTMIRKGSNPDKWAIYYGYTAGGKRVLIHKKDIEQEPQLFIPVESMGVRDVPETPREPLPEPEPVTGHIGSVTEMIQKKLDELSQEEQAMLLEMLGEDGKVEELTPRATSTDNVTNASDTEDVMTIRHSDSPQDTVAQDILSGVEAKVPDIPREPSFNLQKIPGITGGIAEQLEADGVTTKEALLALDVDGLIKYKGIARKRATMILRAASGK